MPNLLAWMAHPETGEFGAQVQLNSRRFVPKPDGSLDVVDAPQTKFFNKEGLSQMAEVAGEKSRPFWERALSDFPRYQALHENKVDVEAGSPKASPQTQYVQGIRPPEFGMS
jgi:hypothetical protein